MRKANSMSHPSHISTIETLWNMEERFWTEGADSARHMSAKSAVFVFPYPTGILRGDAPWREADVAQRWRTVEMKERDISLEDNIAFLVYRASAERGDAPIYQALCMSSYLKDDGSWLRLTHQQTPLVLARE